METNRFRCHASVILENLGTMFWFVVLMLFTSLDEYSEIIQMVLNGEITIFQALISMGVFLAVILIVLAYNWVVWLKTWIVIDEEAIVVERNLLNRKVNTIGMKNISNINMEQNIFERIVGTYKIKLDTNSSTTANETDVKIILSKEKALWFKEQVMKRMQEETGEIEQQTMDYDVEYTMKDIILHCVYTANPVSVLFCIGFLASCFVSLQMFRSGASLVDGMVQILGGVFAVFVVAVSAIQSLIKDFFVYYGFKAKRQEDKIYLAHGLLKKRHYTLAVDKINAVKIVSPVTSRILGRQYVQVICVGVGDEKNENSMLLLSERKEEMERKLSLLLPEYVVEQPVLQSRHKKSLWMEWVSILILICIFGGLGVLAGICNLLSIPSLLARILIVICSIFMIFVSIFGTIMRCRTCKISLGKQSLLIVNGTYGKASIWIPYAKIQELDYAQGPLARHFGYAKGLVFILAASLDSFHATTYFDKAVFDEIQNRMLMRKGRRIDEKKTEE